MTGLKQSSTKYSLYIFLCVITGGIFYLISRWFPKIKAKVIATECPLSVATLVLVEVISFPFPFLSYPKKKKKVKSKLNKNRKIQEKMHK